VHESRNSQTIIEQPLSTKTANDKHNGIITIAKGLGSSLNVNVTRRSNSNFENTTTAAAAGIISKTECNEVEQN